MTDKDSNIDLSVSRRIYYIQDHGFTNCPECFAPLVKEKCTIMLYAKCDHDEGEFMTNLPGGHFCQNCPVVAFDRSLLLQAARMGLRSSAVDSYSVLGIVDLDAIPEDKRHLEMGTDENPIPLVQFMAGLKRKTLSKPNKIGRNDLCSCGSGQKYKNCCGKEV